jgi:hypothetical protein
MSRRCLAELLSEIRKIAKDFFDGLAEFAAWLAAAFGLERLPVKAVIEVLSGIVEQRARLRTLHDLFDRGIFELGSFHEFVQLFNVARVMLPMMELQRFP